MALQISLRIFVISINALSFSSKFSSGSSSEDESDDESDEESEYWLATFESRWMAAYKWTVSKTSERLWFFNYKINEFS